MLHLWWCFSGKLWPKVLSSIQKGCLQRGPGRQKEGEQVWKHAIKDGHHLCEGQNQCCGQPDLQPCALEWEIVLPCCSGAGGGQAVPRARGQLCLIPMDTTWLGGGKSSAPCRNGQGPFLLKANFFIKKHISPLLFIWCHPQENRVGGSFSPWMWLP